MTNAAKLLLAAGLLSVVAGVCCAQEPGRAPAEPIPPHWTERNATIVTPPDAARPCEVGQEHYVVAQTLLGTETGFRFQLAFERECSHTWAGELFLGAAGTRYGLGGALGAGGRVHYSAMWGHYNDVLLVSPGLDLMLLGGHDRRGGIDPDRPKEDVLFLAPSIDFSWLHDFGPHFGWELGTHFGLGIGLLGRDHGGDPAGGELTPLVSVFTGLRF